MSVYLCLKCGRFYPTVNAMKACTHKDKVEVEQKEKEFIAPTTEELKELELSSFTVPQLKIICESLELDGYSQLKKDELVELVGDFLELEEK